MMDDSKKVTNSVTRRPPAAGKGRPKGAANKLTKQVKDMILGALEAAGGESYLYEQALENPKAFMALLGRVLPTETRLAGPDGEALPSAAPVFNVTVRGK